MFETIYAADLGTSSIFFIFFSERKNKLTLRHEVEKVSIGTPVVYGLVGPKAIDKVNIIYCA